MLLEDFFLQAVLLGCCISLQCTVGELVVTDINANENVRQNVIIITNTINGIGTFDNLGKGLDSPSPPLAQDSLIKLFIN